MTDAEANAVAKDWAGYAITIGRSVARPPLYSSEDWDAEALFALAVALKHWKPRPGYSESRGAPASFIRQGVIFHLVKCREAVFRSPNRSRHNGEPSIPRAEFSQARSLDAPLPFDEFETTELYDYVPSPSSPDPFERVCLREMIDSLREASKGLTERERQVLATNLLEPGIAQPGQLEQVSEMLGLSKQRVTELRRTIRRKLKPALGMAA